MVENCRYTVVPTRKRLELVFALVSVNQLSLYEAVAEMCEEYESYLDRAEGPLWEDSRVPRLCQA